MKRSAAFPRQPRWGLAAAVILAVVSTAVSRAATCERGPSRVPQERAARAAGDERTDPRRTDWTRLLPAGEGREYAAALCNSCHSVALVAVQKRTERGWRLLLVGMGTARETDGDWCLCTGGPLDDHDVDVLADYLGRAFNPQNPIDQLPLNVNTASAEALARLPGLGAPDVRKLVAARAAAPLTSRTQVRRLLGERTFRQMGDFVDVQDSLFRFENMLPM